MNQYKNFLILLLSFVYILSALYAVEDEKNDGTTTVSVKDQNEDSYKSFKEVSHKPEIPKYFQKESKNKIWDITKLKEPWLLQDNNDDGIPDYAIIVTDEKFTKSREGIDSNYDGYIDDFAYFDSNGKIIYQEVDSNFDRKIDIWIEIDAGERVNRIQRDINYDEIVDRDLK